MKVKKLISTLTSFILIALVITLTAIFISSKITGGDPTFFGYQLKAVLSGSMEPEFDRGSVIAVKSGGDMTRFEKGDVITFMRDEKTYITHRVLGVKKDGEQVFYETKGDNNEDPDSSPVWSGQVVAEYTGFTVPYIGYFVNFVKSKEGTAAILFVPGVLLIIYAIHLIRSALVDMRTQRQNGPERKSEIKTETQVITEGMEKPELNIDTPFRNRNYSGIRRKK
jgi:signal peptidase I